MITKSNKFIIFIVLSLISANFLFSQDADTKEKKSLDNQIAFLTFRAPSAIDVAFGTAIINGDLPNPKPDIYFKIGYKQHLSNHLSVNLAFNKYNLAFRDLYNEGFLSIDLNFELLFSPHKSFSPYMFAGYGYNASNYFETKSTKAQGGIGLETIVANRVSLRFFGEYNYAFSDELDGLVSGEGDDTFFRIGVGVNFYFGGNKKKARLMKEVKTIFNSNRIIPDS